MTLRKPAIAGAMGAFVAGLLLHLVLPAVVGVVLAVAVSGLTILDPLYAGERVNATWSALGMILSIQVLHTLITAPLAGGLAGSLAPRLQGLWAYLTGAFVSAALHYVLSFIVIAGLSAVAAERDSGQVRGISLALVTVVGPLIGLVGVFVARRRAP